MNVLLRLYPGDAGAFFLAGIFVQVTVVILAAWFLAEWGSRWNAAQRYGILYTAIVSVLVCPVLSGVMQVTGMTLVLLKLPTPTAEPVELATHSESLAPPSNPVELPTSSQIVDIRLQIKGRNSDKNNQPPNKPATSFPDAFRAMGGGIVLMWLAGMVFLVARWCHGIYLIASMRRAARPSECETMADLLNQVRHALGTEKLPPIAISACLDRPIMIGLFRPLVILPEKVLQNFSKSEWGEILIHECAHAVCRHQIVGFLQRMMAILFWPHPLVRLLNQKLTRAREEVCDNYVLRHSDAPRYARTLLELSQLFVETSPKPAALGLFHCRWKLEDRIADLLDRRRKIMIRVRRSTTIALTVAFFSLALLIAGVKMLPASSAADQKNKVVAANLAKPDKEKRWEYIMTKPERIVVFNLANPDNAETIMKSATENLSAVEHKEFSVEFDKQKNRILVMGSEDNIEDVRRLIKQLDPKEPAKEK